MSEANGGNGSANNSVTYTPSPDERYPIKWDEPLLPVTPAEALPEVLTLAMDSGGSGQGITFWSTAAWCGKRALLEQERREEWERDPALIPVRDPSKKGAFGVGSVYHKLHELWREGKLPEDLSYARAELNANVAAGLELFEGWRANFSRDFWGSTVGVEVQLPASERCAKAIEEMFGANVNAKPDLVVRLEEKDLDRARERCPSLPGPGLYLVDFKTAGSAYKDEFYTEGLQAAWYPLAYQMESGEAPVGTIFDIIYKPRHNAKDRTFTQEKFHACFAPFSPARSPALLIGMIEQGRVNIDRARTLGVGNRAGCTKISFGTVESCPFLGFQCEGM